MCRSFTVAVGIAGATLLALGLPASQSRGAVAHVDSTSWIFENFRDADVGTNRYVNPANALLATYSQAAQAWNEGGTSGPVTAGPLLKFAVLAGAPVAKTWTQLKAEVPAPGTTNAYGLAGGGSGVRPAMIVAGVPVFPALYVGRGTADGVVLKATMPIGGTGKATGILYDPVPLAVDPADTGDVVSLHTFLDMSNSFFNYECGGSGALDFFVGLTGSVDYSSGLFDYSVSNGPEGFTSTLNVPSGVQLYLNDATDSGEFDSSKAISQSQLKLLLDGYQTAGGWNPGSAPLLIGMDVPIRNDDFGLGFDQDGKRMFSMVNNAMAFAQEINNVPEPASGALLLCGALVLLGRAAASRGQRRVVGEDVRARLPALYVKPRIGSPW